jgi:hypothetical protein
MNFTWLATSLTYGSKKERHEGDCDGIVEGWLNHARAGRREMLIVYIPARRGAVGQPGALA